MRRMVTLIIAMFFAQSMYVTKAEDFTDYSSDVYSAANTEKSKSVYSEYFGTLSTGEDVKIWHLSNANGISADLIDYGCRIVRINVPDRTGKVQDIVVGYGNLRSFEKGDRFMGPVIGRYGNRIDNASFVLDGVRYDVVANEKFEGEPVQCHGGKQGFDRFVWKGEAVQDNSSVGVKFFNISIDSLTVASIVVFAIVRLSSSVWISSLNSL